MQPLRLIFIDEHQKSSFQCVASRNTFDKNSRDTTETLLGVRCKRAYARGFDSNINILRKLIG